MKTPTLIFGLLLLVSTSFAGATTHVVKQGDNLYRIARNHGLSLTALQAANPSVNAQALRIGQRLVIPDRSGSVTKTSTRAAVTGTYTVVAGDNLSKIARRQGTSVSSLQAANPGLDPLALRVGQKINVTGTRSVAVVKKSSPAPQQLASKPKPSPKPVVTPARETVRETTPAPKTYEPQPVVKQAPTPTVDTPMPTQQLVKEPAPQPVVENPSPTTTTNDPAPALENKAPETKAPTSYRLVKMSRELTLADVATEYGTTPEKINALNGWTFSAQTLLAVDSELYVPAQP